MSKGEGIDNSILEAITPTDVVVHVYGKPVTILAATIIRTREHFAENCLVCIDAAREGKYRVNDLERYCGNKLERANYFLSGAGDHSFTFVQRAVWIQTGDCVPMIAK